MAATATPHADRRRSQRISLSVPLLVVSLDPNLDFSAHLNTREVSGHGCLLSSRRPFRSGTRLRLHLLNDNRTITADVIRSLPVGIFLSLWKVALELNKPGNFWGVPSPPQDWGTTDERLAPAWPP